MGDEVEKTEFLWQVHGYTNEYVRFADGKAAVTIAWASTLMGAMYSADVHTKVMAADATRFQLAIGVIAFLGLLTSFICGVAAVLPRLRRIAFPAWITKLIGKSDRSSKKSVIYWKDIQAHGNAEAFLNAVSGLDKSAIDEALGRHLFVLSDIAAGKYRMVNCSILAAFLGSLFAVALLIFG